MRVGPWVFAAGLTVLTAGILSTRSEVWKVPERGEQTIALDLQGVESLDLGSRDIGQLAIADRPAQIRIKWWGLVEAGADTEPVVQTRDGNQLRLALRSDIRESGESALQIPPGLKTLSGRELDIKAEVNAGALHLESFGLAWEGDAGVLDIRARAWPVAACEAAHGRRLPGVAFRKGRVDQLRISIERGHVHLADLSQVGRIELHAGPEVGISVDRIGDLQRIEMHPFDGEATPPPPYPDQETAEIACKMLSVRR